MALDTFNQQLAARLRAARKAAGFKSAKAFITEHDIPVSTYSQHETGKRTLNAESVVYYSQQLGLNPNWLLTGEGIPFLSNTPDTERHQTLQRELERLNAQTNETHHLPTIEPGLSIVDTEVLSDVLQAMCKRSLQQEAVSMDEQEWVQFCFDVYNTVITSNIHRNTRKQMVQLSIDSFLRGHRLQHKNNKTKETLEG